MAAASDVPLQITPQATPNPFSTRFALNRTILSGGGYDFPSPESAAGAPLALELFSIPGVRGVFLGPNFVTVSVREGTDWRNLPALVTQTIESFLASGKVVVSEALAVSPPAGGVNPADSGIEAGIIRVLEQEIRPAIAMDGGDITFEGFEGGIVRLHLRGSCHGCPSSLVTLKLGIENRLKALFPEVVAVEAV